MGLDQTTLQGVRTDGCPGYPPYWFNEAVGDGGGEGVSFECLLPLNIAPTIRAIPTMMISIGHVSSRERVPTSSRKSPSPRYMNPLTIGRPCFLSFSSCFLPTVDPLNSLCIGHEHMSQQKYTQKRVKWYRKFATVSDYRQGPLEGICSTPVGELIPGALAPSSFPVRFLDV